MVKRFTFKKITDGDYALCYYCGKYNTHFALYDKKDESEVFCCPECAYKVGKIKRLKALLKKYPLRQKKAILETNSLIKMSDSLLLEDTSDQPEQRKGGQEELKTKSLNTLLVSRKDSICTKGAGIESK